MIPDYIPAPVPTYSKPGTVYIAQWYTRNEGHHALVARCRELLLPMLRAVMEEYGEIEIKKCFRGEVVLPPAWMVEKIRQRRYESLILHVKDSACEHARVPVSKLDGPAAVKRVLCGPGVSFFDEAVFWNCRMHVAGWATGSFTAHYSEIVSSSKFRDYPRKSA